MEEEGKKVKQKQTRLPCCRIPQPADNSTAINNQSLIFLACLVASVFLFYRILCLSLFFFPKLCLYLAVEHDGRTWKKKHTLLFWEKREKPIVLHSIKHIITADLSKRADEPTVPLTGWKEDGPSNVWMESEERGADLCPAMTWHRSHEFQSFSQSNITGGGGACSLAPVSCDARLALAKTGLPCTVLCI